MPKYIAKYLNLKLINKASYTKEVEGRVVVVSGSSIQFTDGVYETTDKDEIAFLENHPNCGNVFIKIGKEDVGKARKEFVKTSSEKKIEEAEEKEKEEVKEKTLKEGVTPKGKGKKSTKKEKPKF